MPGTCEPDAILRIANGTPVAIGQAATREAPRIQPKRGTAATTHRTAAVHSS